ncbi:MAG: AEC family transporter [Hyphomicrobiaceae bacterium]
MFQVITIIAPIFALIAIGFLAGRLAWVGPETTKGLASFTFTLAIPALLFRAMVVADLPGAELHRIAGAYFGSAFAVWLVAALLTSLILRRPAADGVPIAMSAGFANVVMIGLPISLIAFGSDATAPGAVIVSLHSIVLWITAALHMAWVNRSGAASIASTAGELFREIARNVIILAVVAGTAWRFTGLGLHPVPDQIVGMLGQAAIPCALVSLGLSLVGFEIKGQAPTLGMILILKMLAMPAIAWMLAREVFDLPALETSVVVLFAAMPTGANAYLFAVQHGRAMNSASGAVALGTAISAVSATLVVYALQ